MTPPQHASSPAVRMRPRSAPVPAPGHGPDRMHAVAHSGGGPQRRLRRVCPPPVVPASCAPLRTCARSCFTCAIPANAHQRLSLRNSPPGSWQVFRLSRVAGCRIGRALKSVALGQVYVRRPIRWWRGPSARGAGHPHRRTFHAVGAAPRRCVGGNTSPGRLDPATWMRKLAHRGRRAGNEHAARVWLSSRFFLVLAPRNAHPAPQSSGGFTIELTRISTCHELIASRAAS